MEFNPRSVCIHGVGLLGGSIGSALKASGYRGRIIGISSSAGIATALSLGIIDEGFGYDGLAQAAARVDCIFLCTPIAVIMKTLEQLGTMALPRGLLITDVGSTKSQINDCARRALPASVTFIGGHPMAGSEKNGVGASDPFLFQNALYLLTQPSGAPFDPGIGSFPAFLQRYLGCRTLTVDPEEHDAIIAAVSHAPHILAVALVHLARNAERRRTGTLALAAGGFRDMTRIASAPYGLWRDILMTNKKAIMSALDEYIDILRDMQTELSADGLKDRFESAAATRREIPAGAKGFIHSQSDIVVVAKDQPGVIAQLSAALAAENINIKDIEVLKVREGEAGTIRLAFGLKEAAGRAVAVLTAAGFTARERD